MLVGKPLGIGIEVVSGFGFVLEGVAGRGDVGGRVTTGGGVVGPGVVAAVGSTGTVGTTVTTGGTPASTSACSSLFWTRCQRYTPPITVPVTPAARSNIKRIGAPSCLRAVRAGPPGKGSIDAVPN
jgi:hypothetical protein